MAPPALVAGEKMVFAITEPDAGSNSHNLSTTATPRRRRLPAPRHQDLHLRRRRGGADARRRAHRRRRRHRARAALALRRRHRRARARAARRSPWRSHPRRSSSTLFFDDVEVPADRLIGDEGDGLRQVFVGLNPERITERRRSAPASARYALDVRRRTRTSARCGACRSGRTRASPHPLAQAKIEVELARLMTAKAAWMHDHADRPGRRGRGREHGQVRGRGSGPALRSTPRSRRTAATAWPSSTASPTCGGSCGSLRIAPVSREMILNFVAQQSLGLPKSY